MERVFHPQTQGKTVIFTGGLNEEVSNLELTAGELYDCSNYMEMAGRYHGYASPKGNEVSDGATTTITGIATGAVHASDVEVVANPDEGASEDPRVTFLLESEGLTDLSVTSATVTTSGDVYADPAIANSFDQSYRLQNSGAIHITSGADYDFAQASASKVATIEGWFQVPVDPAGDTTLAKKAGSWELAVDTDRNVIFTYGLTAASSASVTGSSVLDFNVFNHIRVTYAQDNKFRLYVAGTLGATSTSGVPYETSNDVVIGGSVYPMWVESFRMSSCCRGTHDFDVPDVPFSTEGFFDIAYDDSWREYKRGLIEPVSAATKATSGEVLQVIEYDNPSGASAYPITARTTSGASTIRFFEQTSGGWSHIDTALTAAVTSATDVRMTLGRFSEWQANEETVFITISTDTAEAFYYYDGATMTGFSPSGILPAASASKPKSCYCHDNRLFLLYPRGELYISGIGDPTLWDGSTDNADLYDFPSELVAVQHLSDNVIGVFCEKGIYMLKGVFQASDAGGTGWLWDQSTITEATDVVSNTVQQFGKTTYFVSKEGLKSLESSDTFGDFAENTLSHKVNDTLLDNLDYIVGSSISKEFGQYRLFFVKDGENFALYFTFNPDSTVKGATIIDFNQQDDTSATISCITHSKRSGINYFGSSDGYLYKMDSGTSDNGQDIVTNFKSAYNNCGSPRLWKVIRSLLFEMDTASFLEFTIKVRFGYDRSDLPKADQIVKFIKTAGGKWGTAVYGNFIWGGGIIGNPMFYPYGHGVNFSIEVSTSNRWLQQHIVNNVIVDYSTIGRQI